MCKLISILPLLLQGISSKTTCRRSRSPLPSEPASGEGRGAGGKGGPGGLVKPRVVLGILLLLSIGNASAQERHVRELRVNLDCEDTKIARALHLIFDQVNKPYRIATQEVNGTVTCSLKAQPLSVVLRLVLNSANPPLDFHMEDEVYVITLKRITRAPATSPPAQQKGGAQNAKTAPPAPPKIEPAEYDPHNPQLLLQASHEGQIFFSPDGRTLVNVAWTYTNERSVELWDVASGKLLCRPLGSVDVDGINLSGRSKGCFSPDGRFLAVVEQPNRIHLWDTRTGKAASTFQINFTDKDAKEVGAGGITPAIFSPDGKTLACPFTPTRYWGPSSGIAFVNVETGYIRVAQVDGGIDTTHIAFSPNGKILTFWWLKFNLKGVNSTFSYQVTLLDVETGREIKTIPVFTSDVSGESGQLEFSPDGVYLAAGYNGTPYRAANGDLESMSHFQLWNVATGQMAFQGDGRISAFSSDSAYLISDQAHFEHNPWTDDISVWKIATGKAVHRQEIATPYGIQFSPNAGLMAAMTPDGRLKLREVASGKELHTLEGKFSDAIFNFSPDGKMLITSQPRPEFWSVKTGKLLRALPADWPSNYSPFFALSPDGNIFAVEYEGMTELWDLKTAQRLRRLGVPARTGYRVVYSPDGKLLAACTGNTVAVYAAGTGRRLHTLRSAGTLHGASWGHDHLIFSPDGKTVVSTGADAKGNVFIVSWDVASGKVVRTLDTHMNEGTDLDRDLRSTKITNIAFGPGGKLWASVLDSEYTHNPFNSHNVISLWNLATGDRTTLYTFDSKTSGVRPSAFSPDGKYYSSMGRVWDVETGSEISQFVNDHTKTNMADELFVWASYAFSPNAKSVGIGPGLWDVQSGQYLHTYFDAALGFAEASSRFSTFSPDGNTIAVSRIPSFFDSENRIELFNLTTGKLIRTLTGHTGAVLSAAFSPDGRFLASGGYDGTTRIWDVATGEEVLRITALGDDDYVASTPDNFYVASKGAARAIEFRVEDNLYPFEQFDLKLNRPDIVLKRLGYAPKSLIDAYHHAYEQRLKKMKFTPEMLGQDYHLPEVSLDYKALPATTNDKTIKFSVQASDSKYLLDRLNIYVNNVPIYGTGGIDLRARKTKSIRQEITMHLSAGRNKVQVSALNEKGAESLFQTFEVLYTAPVPKPDLYIVTVGVSNYQDSRLNLQYAAKDAADLATFFQQQETQATKPPPAAASLPHHRGRSRSSIVNRQSTIVNAAVTSPYHRVHALRLLDHAATRDNILKAKSLLMQSGPDDVVILFLAGHGFLDKQTFDFYFATTEVNLNALSTTALPYDEIEGLLDGIPARKKLLLMDSCHSGEIDTEDLVPLNTQVASAQTAESKTVKTRSFAALRGEATSGLGLSSSFELLRDLFADLRRGSGAAVIAAAGGLEFSMEKDQWKNGAFTYAVLEGLRTRKADLNHDGHITVSELRDYVIGRVGDLTDYRQQPTSRRENLELDFDIE